ncbi:MAG: hypothetical protein WCH11_06965, partial [Bdellovibrio sp.]
SVQRRPDLRKDSDSNLDFSQFFELSEIPQPRAAFCTLGTTIKKAGSREAFRSVDLDLVLSFARKCRELGFQRMGVVSAIGADKKSLLFYIRIKGEMEEALKSMGFAHLVFVRPSLLLGPRAEFRLGEYLGEKFARIFSFAFLGPGLEWKPVAAKNVAQVLVKETLSTREKLRIISNRDLLRSGASSQVKP